MPTVHDLADHLAPLTDRARYHREGDPAGVWIASGREVRTLGLRLEPGRPPYDWAEGLDAVFLHRPFGVWPAQLPEGLGVLAVHRALDDRFSVGHSPALADAMGVETEGDPLRRGGTPIGLVGRLRQRDVGARVAEVFGGVEATLGEPREGDTVALVGAMTPELVADAADRGVSHYVTGQIRGGAREAAEAAGLRVIAVGQARAETWGLRYLAGVLRDRWPSLAVVWRG